MPTEWLVASTDDAPNHNTRHPSGNVGRTQKDNSPSPPDEFGRSVPKVAMKALTHKQFDQIARDLFGSALCAHGFTCVASKRCTFTRQINADVYHVIIPDPGTRCAWYDIHVFPTSPRFHHDFDLRFPDGLGNTLDAYGKLSETAGIGMDQQRFNCKYESNMRNRFNTTVLGLLQRVAVPFLDAIQTYEDILPHLRGPFSRFRGS